MSVISPQRAIISGFTEEVGTVAHASACSVRFSRRFPRPTRGSRAEAHDGTLKRAPRLLTPFSGLGVLAVLLGSGGSLMYADGRSPVRVFRNDMIDVTSAGDNVLPNW